MTPAARVAAAIAVLDRVLTGEAAEKALTNWGRSSRYAGSGDRAAVRDLVYDALRCKRSYGALGGGVTGRGLMLGRLRAAGEDPAPLFTGDGHAPAALTADDAGCEPAPAEALDCPDWLLPMIQASLGADAEPVLLALRQRAPVFLRANLARVSREQAITALAADGIAAAAHPLARSALEVTGNARKVQTSAAYAQGLVELQDAASQAVAEAVPLADGQKVLDYCAGGGGKTLALAARARRSLYAHDANPRRMADLPARAARAGAKVILSDNPAKTAPYDVVLIDVPCSGSGSWRRDPEGKWALNESRLAELTALQAQILDAAAALVAPDGVLAYATCSLLAAENEDQIAAFLARHPDWRATGQQRFSPLQGGDGFFFARLARAKP